MKETRRLGYRSENLVEETTVVKVGSGNGRQGFINILKRFDCFANETRTSHKLGPEIEEITSQITNPIREINDAADQARLVTSKTDADKELEHFVGMDDDIEKLVSLLVSDQESGRRVIGVWGPMGSGKTTVAKKVYEHVHVRRYFDSFAWVNTTQESELGIVKQLLPDVKNEEVDIDELVKLICGLQMEKKCLIVLDDILEHHDSKVLSRCLPNDGSRSKILLTTPCESTAKIGYPIRLRDLTEDEAWRLLRMKAFEKGKVLLVEPRDDSEYEKFGREMVRKCDHFPKPIAVAKIGGILRGKNSLQEWELVSYDLNYYIRTDEGPGESEKWLVPRDVDLASSDVELASSYDKLPFLLKIYFLSMGFLGEGERVSVDRICELWMAEGLIEQESVDHLARRYLILLNHQNMVQLDDLGNTLSLDTSRLHLCRSKAEKFLKVVDISNVASENAERLVLHIDHGDEGSDVIEKVGANVISLTSLHITPRPGSNLLINLPKKMFNLPKFRSLRILIVSRCDLRGKCFHGMEKLIHLRLLGLKDCKWGVCSLEWIHKLFFLQILDLSGTQLSLFPVDTFCNVRQLRHLYLPLFPHTLRIQRKLRLLDLPQLETLCNFQSQFYDSNDLIRLQNLRTLRRYCVNDDQSLVQIIDLISRREMRWIHVSIKNCDLIGSYALEALLRISMATLKLEIESCILFKLPELETANFSEMRPGLVDLELADVDIAKDCMSALGKFPNLRKLGLRCVRFGGKEMVCDARSFPRLEQVYFYRVVGKFELRIEEAAMPNLSSMRMLLCSGINFQIPERFRKFAKIDRCSVIDNV